MSKFLVAVGISAFSCLCRASTVVPSHADPVIYKVVSAHYEAGFCKAPALQQKDRAKLIHAAMAVSVPGLVYDQVFTPMDYAVIADDVASVKHLIAVGYPITARLPDGGGLLHLAAWNGSKSVTSFLLNQGIDANATTESGSTPLMVAASEGRVDLVKLLLRHGASVHARMRDGSTPLSYSMLCKNQTLVDLLLDAGADVDAHAMRLGAKFGLSLVKHER